MNGNVASSPIKNNFLPIIGRYFEPCLQMNKEKQGRGGGGGEEQGKKLTTVMSDVCIGRIGFSLGMLKRKQDKFGDVCF
jgi:hypothetical protein